MRIVAALGGNVLLQRGERPDASLQEAHVREAAAALLPLAREHSLVITHGNGPQVGLLAMESGQDPALSRPYPFDVLVAQTQGMIGYWLVQALANLLPGGQAACVLTRTLVRAHEVRRSRLPRTGSPPPGGPVRLGDQQGRFGLAACGRLTRSRGAAGTAAHPDPAGPRHHPGLRGRRRDPGHPG
jgi:hypothetical protein